MNFKRAAGVLLFAGAVLFLTGMHIAEYLYPGYSVSGNYISDLAPPAAPHASFISLLLLFSIPLSLSLGS